MDHRLSRSRHRIIARSAISPQYNAGIWNGYVLAQLSASGQKQLKFVSANCAPLQKYE